MKRRKELDLSGYPILICMPTAVGVKHVKTMASRELLARYDALDYAAKNPSRIYDGATMTKPEKDFIKSLRGQVPVLELYPYATKRFSVKVR